MDEIFNLINELNKIKKDNFKICLKRYKYIINNNIKDSNLIERLLDDILNNIYDDKSLNIYIKLCEYYRNIDKEGSDFYLKLLKEEDYI